MNYQKRLQILLLIRINFLTLTLKDVNGPQVTLKELKQIQDQLGNRKVFQKLDRCMRMLKLTNTI